MHSKSNDNYKNKPNPHKPLVLIIENDWDNLLFATYVVESLGMAFVYTEQSENCLELVNKLLPDVILLDIVMPRIDGLQIARLIKHNKNTSHIPIIAVTGLTRPKDISQVIQAGCDAYLSKPYLIEDLELKLNTYLKSSWADGVTSNL